MQETWEFDLWVKKFSWRRKWRLTPVFLPAEYHGEKSLAGYSPWDHKVSDTAKRLTLSFTFFSYTCVCMYIQTHTHISLVKGPLQYS